MNVNISENDLIAEIVTSTMNETEILDFIANLADYASGYFPTFQQQVIDRMEADK